MENGNSGFTLIELMIVIAIIGMLSTMALPSYQDRVIRAQVQEGVGLADFIKEGIEAYYREKRKFPDSNEEIGLPIPRKIIGNYVALVKITEGGAIDVTFGNRSNKHIHGKVITLRPAVVRGAPMVPVAWINGWASVPRGMTVASKNNTTLLLRHLPMDCRY